MELKPIKKIKTSCPFPLLQYTVGIYYNAVRKPSGIAYILLELIQKSNMESEKVATVLKKFGIPAELHIIFGQELAALTANGILEASIYAQYLSDPKYFEQAMIGDFKLTAKGKKMFAEGAIPIEGEKKKTPEVFYSPVSRTFALNNNMFLAKIGTSFLGENFLDDVEYDISNLEDYLKSVQTDAKIGLKKEEMIVRIDPGEPKGLVVKPEKNMTITIDEKGVVFSFETTDEKAFFERYYSSSLMSAGILAKENYKFSSNVATIEWDSFDIDDVHIPADINKKANQDCEIFISRGRLGVHRDKSAITFFGDNGLLSMLDENAEFALLDNIGCRYYLPVNVRFYCKNFDDVFEMQLLLEKSATPDVFESVVQEICAMTYEAKFCDDSAKIISYAAKMLNDSEYLNGYAIKQLNECSDDVDRIALLLKLNYAFSKCEGWNAYFAEIAKEIFERYIQTVELENIIFKNTVLTPLRKAMEMPEAEYISALAEPLKEKESAELVYQALESASFGESEILAVVNVIDLYAVRVLERTPIDAVTELSNKFALYSSNLWKLCDMLGVENPNDYTLKDDYNIDEFFNIFATYSKAQKYVDKYKAYAKATFEQLKRFDAIFNPIQEILSIERTASEHPEKVTKKFIDEQISRGRYSVAISNLLIKAQYDLRILLSADLVVGANELIDEAESQGIIKRDEATQLHKLRMCRNGLQHPEKRQIPFDKETIEEWRDTVFSLKGEQN